MTRPTRLFVHEKALEAAVACDEIARQIPIFRRDLSDQLWRASSSIALNIAEGAREFSPPEKMRIYRIARREAAECETIIELVERILPSISATGRARGLLDEVQALLTRTIQSLDERTRARKQT